MAPRPRGRPRKRPLARMDVAIDAMKPFGFSRDIVVETIKELQNVYGEDGWPFIEEGSYKVLLEAILEKVNGGEASDSKKPDGETSMALEITCSESDANPPKTALQTTTAMEMDPLSETNEALGTTKLTTESGNQTFHTMALEPTCSKSDANPLTTTLQTSTPMEMDPASETNKPLGTTKLKTESEGEHLSLVEAGGHESERRHVDVELPLSTNQPTAPLPTDEPPLPDSSSSRQPQRSRRPYYGWMCSDEEEDKDLVVLKPGTLGQEIEDRLASLRRQKERKQRWDVKPDGI